MGTFIPQMRPDWSNSPWGPGRPWEGQRKGNGTEAPQVTTQHWDAGGSAFHIKSEGMVYAGGPEAAAPETLVRTSLQRPLEGC